jgi:hypothetical protein
MGEGRATLLVANDSCYSDAVSRAFEVADESSEPIQAGIEAAVEMAELNPEGARAALWHLQADWSTLEELEERLGGDPTQAALRVGAAIQFARAELSCPEPQLRRRLPELLDLIGGID